MAEKIILTIGRQFGSGGREIGKKLADSLNIAYYDKELLNIAAQESGLNREFFEKADEQASNPFAYALSLGFSSLGNPILGEDNYLSKDQLFKIQSDAIRMLAEKDSCVIVGRCADYILRDERSRISFFVIDSPENRIRRITETLQLSEKEAKEKMTKIDKSRAAYYNYYTDKIWGAATSYHLCVDVSVLSVNQTITVMKQFVEKAMENRFSQ